MTSDADDLAELRRRLQHLTGLRVPAKESGEGDPADDEAPKPVGLIGGDRGQSKKAQEALNHVRKRRDAEIDRLNADNRRRTSFFWFVLIVTAFPVLVASGVMIRIAVDGQVSDPVLIAFFASVVVEVIGLSIIVANYLFPKNGSLTRNDHNEE